MKKLVALIGAVAMGFGLFADDPVSFSTSFEAGEPGVAGATFTPGDGWTWEGNPLALGAYADDAYTYGTGDYARRFDGAQTQYLQLETGDKALARDLGAGNTTVDQLVQFTGYDAPLTEFAADAKIAVWMLGTENTDDTPGETNLYVTCGAEKDALKLVAPAGTTWQTEKWYRLTVKSLGIDATGREQFNIYIDGQLLSSVGQDTQTVFPSMAENELVTKMKIQGIGAIDDLTIDADGPLFTQSVEFTVELPANVASATVTGAEQTATGWKAKNGAAIAITYTAAEGYLFNNKQSTITVNTTAAKGTIAATDDVKSATEAKAKIGTTIYLTLQDAFDAAVDGDTIVVVAATEVAEKIEIAKKVTLDATGKTVVCAAKYPFCVKGGELTIVDGTFTQDVADGIILWARDGGKITVNGGSFSAIPDGEIAYVQTADAKIDIYGGTFVMADKASGAKGDVLNVAQTLGLDRVDYITCYGGSFSKDPAEGDDALGGSFVASGYASVPNGDMFNVVSAAADFAKVTVGGEVTYYNDLAAALEAGKAAGSLVELTNNVDLAGINWIPVADFAGTFDGKGYIISNLTVVAEGNASLIAKFANGSKVCNLTFENVTAHNTLKDGKNGRAAALTCDPGSGSIVSNVTLCGKIDIKGYKYIGGIVAHLGYSDFIDCHVDGGSAETSFIGQWADYDDEGQVGGIGGMTGEAGVTVYRVCNCSVKNVSMYGNERVGGILGRIYTTQVTGCTAENLLIKGPASKQIGGLIGVCLKQDDKMPMFIVNSTATNVSLFDLDDQPLAYTDVGDLQRTVISTDAEGVCIAFWPAQNFGFTAGTFTLYGDATADQLSAQVAEGCQLVDQGDGVYKVVEIPVAQVTVGETVTTYGRYTFNAALEAGKAAGSLVELIADVDLKGIDWTPVANFAGIFDGKGYKISNLKITGLAPGTTSGAALISTTGNESKFRFQNVTFENVDINAPGVQQAAVVSGYCGGGMVSNVTVTGEINIVGMKYVGAIVGTSYIKVVDCHVDGVDKSQSCFYAKLGNDDGAQVGGITGYNPGGNSTQIIGCSVKNLTIKADTKCAGGIAGRMLANTAMVDCAVENVDVLSGDAEARAGTIVGESYVQDGAIRFYLNSTAKDCTLSTIDGTPLEAQPYGTTAKNATNKIVFGTGAKGYSMTTEHSVWKFTAGTFELSNVTLEAFNAYVAEGCEAIKKSEGVYEIKKVWDVTLINGETTVDTQTVIDGECATNVTLAVEGFKGWTNETYTTGFDFATPIAADLTLYAWIEAAAPWSDVEKGEIEGVTEENKAAVEAQLDAIKAALGEGADEAAVGGWLTKVYGNQKVPVADVVAANNIAISVKYDLPLMANDPEIEVAKDEEASDGFTFTIKDGEKDVSVAVAKVEEIVKYSDTVDGTFAKNTEKIAVTPAGTVIKANFRKPNNETQGFMKAELK